MKLSKLVLIVFSMTGLTFLAACGTGQSTGSGSRPTAASDTTGKTEASSRDIQPVTQTGNARMTLSELTMPLPQGKTTLRLVVADPTGQPLAVQGIEAEMTMSEQAMEAMGMKEMGAGSAKTEVKSAASPGTYDIETNFPFGGDWQLTVALNDAQPPARAVFDIPVQQ
ncbi:hypothetical protein HJG54_34990 (plasmid) [Leptolyngbya sp. NK1-12]|uniref:YtkA-like domain-containing protein n=1 Tax=Leptolyngbya sp. NK1-12 TaxID=2547451 RepID=A0AA97AKQ9_9CYAN|nr:hypothetical protein HJG54_34990 [Leptolyngbya sp. NK1-12]